jgi:hypothetical protein
MNMNIQNKVISDKQYGNYNPIISTYNNNSNSQY